MVQSLQLGGAQNEAVSTRMRRLNRLPVLFAAFVALIFFAVVVTGLSWRGLSSAPRQSPQDATNSPASSFGEQMKRGVTDGIIGDTEIRETFQPIPPPEAPPQEDVLKPYVPAAQATPLHRLEAEADWRARMKREQDEQYLRELQRQRMARLQAQSTALDSPLNVEVSKSLHIGGADDTENIRPSTSSPASALDLAAAVASGGLEVDPNGQSSKRDFFNQDIKVLGYLPNRVVGQVSRFELKRGSVIPATLISGLNSDLPGRLTAQVSQNVYDSATGDHLLIPQGARLLGRYDSNVSFGQQRALVIWTDVIFPDGATLQIAGMAGTDREGYGGFSDKVDRHLWRTFGSAALVAIIGTGIDMSLPESSTRATQDTASDAARRNFAESFGRVAEQTISRNLNVQPTIRIRPGYQFNVLVDQDIVFHSAYQTTGGRS